MTNVTTTPTKKATWEAIEARVLSGFDLDDVSTACAVKAWKQQVSRTQESEQVGEVVHSFEAPDVLDAVVDFFQADIRENLAIHEAKVARNGRLLTHMKLRAALGSAEGVFPDDEDGERVVAEQLTVLKVSKASKITQLQQVIQASRRIAGSDSESDAGDDFPHSLGDGIREFVTDLQKFVATNGSEGREVIASICDDTEYARDVLRDDEMPRPLRYLAEIVIETSTINRLPQRKCKVIFGFARR